VSAVDEQARILSLGESSRRVPTCARSPIRCRRRCRGGALAAAFLICVVSIGATGCAWTEVALVSVQNETPATVHVRSRLRGNTAFENPFDLTPAEQRPLMKYEEGRFTVEPISNLVLVLEVVTPAGCILRLDDGALQRTATRDPDARRWTVHVRPDALAAATCEGTKAVGQPVERSHGGQPGTALGE